jgi:lysophospholipase L1-like esterase
VRDGQDPGPIALRRPSRRGAIVFAIGVIGLLGAAFILMGRAPGITLMRGGGPLSLTLLAASAGPFTVAVASGARRLPGRTGFILAALCVAATATAGVIVMRHIEVGIDDFRLSTAETRLTRALLQAALVAFAALWLWPGVAHAVATVRAGGVRGLRLLPALLRLGAARWLVPLKAPAINLALVAGAITVALIAVEAAIRVSEGGNLLLFENLVTRKVDLLVVQGANQYDPLLGWVLEPNQAPDPNGGFSTGEHGVRMNGRAIVPVPRHGILASGDSFTAGSEVNNWESWPAQLEAMLGQPVVNAATGGWGTDQIVLRAESLMAILQPKAIVISFLADDILRAGYQTFGGGNKPYFTVEDGALVAHNDPVPRFAGGASEIGWLRSLFGFSHLVAYVMQATGYYEWWFGSVNRRVANDIVNVSCRLLERLKAKTDVEYVALYLVMQYGPNLVIPLDDEPGYAAGVLACARAAGITTIDTWSALHAVRQRDALQTMYNVDRARGQYGHMSPEGNALIARMIAETLRSDTRTWP